jgi:hypothetical protein
MMPGETNDKYRRNFARAVGLVVAARVSVRNIDSSSRYVLSITHPFARRAVELLLDRVGG